MHVELELVWGQTFCSTCLDKVELHLESKIDVGVLITELPRADMIPAGSYSRTGRAVKAIVEKDGMSGKCLRGSS